MDKNRGFTLVELLVVIAIISVLAGLLLPALENALQSAYQIKCSSALKQWGQGTLLYVNDHDGSFPLSLNQQASRHWNALLWPYAVGHEYSSAQLKLPGLHRCPTDSIYSPEEGNYSVDYAINSDVCPWVAADGSVKPAWTVGPIAAATKISRVNKQAGTLLLVDRVDGVGTLDYMDRTNPAFSNPAVDYRHSDGCNILFVDGHVDRLENPGPGNHLDIAAMSNSVIYE